MCEALIGRKLAHYRLVSVLGQGGMGCVYRAVDEKMDRTVAVKLIRHKFGVFSAREGKALGQLSHPNIVNVYHMDECEEGVFIVMEHVSGKTLRKYKNIPVTDALKLLKQSLLALEHAHNAGVIHRDIKPGNIMVNDAGNVKVMDFGLAKVNSNDKNRTLTKFQAGTINYMSPEQIRGLHHVDHRSDIYSLGKAFYEILAGRLPFDPSDSDQFDIWKMIVEVKFKPPSHFRKSIPPEIDRLIMKALEKDREDRYPTARAMIEAVENIEAGVKKQVKRQVTEQVHYTRPALYGKPPAPKSSKKGLLFGITAAVLLLGAAGVYYSGIWDGSLTAGNSQPTLTREQTTTPEQTPAIVQEELPPAPTPASILITSDPPDARLQLADKYIGITPSDTLQVMENEIQIRLEKDNYVALDTTLTVVPGAFTPFHLALLPEAQPDPEPLEAGENPPATASISENGMVYVETNQDGAIVTVDGRRVGTAPLMLSLAAGSHQIEVSAPGYSTYASTIAIRPDQEETVNAELSVLTSRLRVRVNPFGAIYLNGTLEEDEEMGWFERTLPQGQHTLRAVHPTFGEWEKVISLDEAEEVIRINFLVTKSVNVTSGRINGASIYVNGEPTGFETPKVVEVGVGLRRIEVRKEGFTASPAFQEILIEEDTEEPVRITFDLE